MTVPDVTVPDVAVPDVPDVAVPDVTVPDVPDVPDVTVSAMFLSGSPRKRRMWSLHATVRPALAGPKGRDRTPRRARTSAHDPVDPVRGQLAPPHASTVVRLEMVST